MSGFEGFITRYSDQITIFISILIALYGFWKWLRKENKSAVTLLRKELLGDKEDGNGGIIGELKKEHLEDIKHLEEKYQKNLEYFKKDIENNFRNDHVNLLNQHKQSIQEMRYIRQDLNKAERTLEKITDGHYTRSRRGTSYQNYDNDIKEEDY